MDHALEWLKKIGEEIRGYHKEDRITAYDRALIAVGQAVLQNPDLIAADTFMTDLNRAEQARILKYWMKRQRPGPVCWWRMRYPAVFHATGYWSFENLWIDSRQTT